MEVVSEQLEDVEVVIVGVVGGPLGEVVVDFLLVFLLHLTPHFFVFLVIALGSHTDFDWHFFGESEALGD